MNRKMTGIAVLLAIAALTGCGAQTEDSAAVQETTAAVETEEVTETAAETEAAAETETEAGTEAATEAEADAETEEGSAADEAEEQRELADCSSIAGFWFIDGDATKASIHIAADSTYAAFNASGETESKGQVYYTSEEIEGTTHYWFSLYDEEGAYFTGFLDDGSESKNDLYAGNGATPHYVKLFGEGGLGDDGREPGEEDSAE